MSPRVHPQHNTTRLAYREEHRKYRRQEHHPALALLLVVLAVALMGGAFVLVGEIEKRQKDQSMPQHKTLTAVERTH